MIDLTASKIIGRVRKLAALLSADYKGKRPVLLFVMNGSCVLAGDLMRAMRTPCEIDYISACSYVKTEQQRAVSIQPGRLAGERLQGRHVVIVDTIIDTGATVQQVADFVYQQKPASMALACLINKQPTYRKDKIQPAIKYAIWTYYHDDYLVGYGLDYQGFFRSMPDIVKLRNIAPERRAAVDEYVLRREAALEGKRPKRRRGFKALFVGNKRAADA